MGATNDTDSGPKSRGIEQSRPPTLFLIDFPMHLRDVRRGTGAKDDSGFYSSLPQRLECLVEIKPISSGEGQ